MIANDTIAAMATPMGTSGIGIIRVSGRDAVSIVAPLFSCRRKISDPNNPALTTLRPRHLKYGYIVDPVKQRVVDEVMVVVMKGPNSYTCEDVVEIQSHSGYVIMSTILNLVIDQGARLAEPGEFTKRAFLNGRIDLSQAEAVADVISARSETALQLATTHLTGHLRDKVNTILETLNDMIVDLEAGIEFPDETGGEINNAPMATTLEKEVKDPVSDLLQHYHDGHVLREGIRLGIVGRPNVGKSSLLNRILLKDKAIVTPIAGTTRDLVEDQTCIEGVPVMITDTAGLRPSTDPIEIIGIQKTHENIAASDIILFVIDASQSFNDEDRAVFELIKQQKFILCVNKVDLVEKASHVILPDDIKGLPRVDISAKTGEGIGPLKKAIKTRCLSDVKIEPGQSIVPNKRQKIALQDAMSFIEDAMDGIGRGITEELIVSDLKQVMEKLNIIIGNQINVDILDDVFKRFCIGK